MKKSKLVSLLSIPILSFTAATTSCKFLTRPMRLMKEQSIDASSQEQQEYPNISQEQQEYPGIKAETVGAGVIDFLLGNPKTASLMNPTEQLALGLIGNFLGIRGQRKHEIDYARAGRNQLIINTTDGKQAQLVRDTSGDVYIVMEGTIYPLSQEFINQARGTSATLASNRLNAPVIEGATLPLYNLIDLESRFNSNPTIKESYDYKVYRKEYLSDIAKKLRVPKSNIFYWADKGGFIWDVKSKLRPIKNQKEIWEDKKKIKRSLPFSSKTTLVIFEEKYKNQISAVFSYKWQRDLNNDGNLDFNEFNQIKRTFYDNENFNIGVKYQTEKGFKGNLEIKILKGNTGELITNEKVEIVSNGPMLNWRLIPKETFSEGTYLVHTTLLKGGRKYADSFSTPISSQTEKFEIIKAPETEKKK